MPLELLLHIFVSVFQQLLCLAVMLPHYQLLTKVNYLLHERLEHIEELSRIGNDLAVEALLELIDAVVRVLGVFVELLQEGT